MLRMLTAPRHGSCPTAAQCVLLPRVLALPHCHSCAGKDFAEQIPRSAAMQAYVDRCRELADSQPHWIIVALCGLDEPTTVAELESSLAKEPAW